MKRLDMEAYNVIPEWNEITFRKPTPEEEKCAVRDWSYMVENLPEYGEEVLITDGENIWIDKFDEDISGEVYLSDTVDEVTAWMPLPNPYKGE